jgi:hypothetical protein
MSVYHFQLLRYAPNRLAEEFYNVAVLLHDAEGRLVDARFTPDFTRLRCHPLADLPLVERLKEEFENRLLAGEGFAEFVGELTQNLSQALQLSERRAFLGGETQEAMERLVRTYLATPRRSEVRPPETLPGTRRWIHQRLHHTFEQHHLLERLEAAAPVGVHVSPRFSFQMDYAYRPNGQTRYVHALSLRHDLNDAARLCFVFDRVRAQTDAALTAVVDDALPDDTRGLLESSRIRPWEVSRVEDLALAVRGELGL